MVVVSKSLAGAVPNASICFRICELLFTTIAIFVEEVEAVVNSSGHVTGKCVVGANDAPPCVEKCLRLPLVVVVDEGVLRGPINTDFGEDGPLSRYCISSMMLGERAGELSILWCSSRRDR